MCVQSKDVGVAAPTSFDKTHIQPRGCRAFINFLRSRGQGWQIALQLAESGVITVAYDSVMPPTPNRLLSGWKSASDVDEWARAHEFGEPIELTDRNLRALSRAHSGHPVGLYLWEGAEHEIYLGISADSVVKRLRRHLIDYDFANIQNFRYRHHAGTSRELRDIERQCIWEAIWTQRLVVFNTEHASSVLHNTDFDRLVTEDEQLVWFEDPATANLASDHAYRTPDPSELARSTKNYPRFMRMPDADRIISAVSLYLRAAVPFPFQTQVQYWSVSCLPALGLTDGYKRLVTLSMGILEMLWINQAPSGAVDVRMGTDYRFLPPGDTEAVLRRLGVEMAGILHDRGGANEEVLIFPSTETFVHALQTSAPIRIAAARFALDRMRMGKVTRHKESHNYLLAEEALSRADGWPIASESLDLSDTLETTL